MASTRIGARPSTERHAVYTNLARASTVFRVDGVEQRRPVERRRSDGRGSMSQPMFWQTAWFRFSVILLDALRRWDLPPARAAGGQGINVRFEERLAERTRIAQELHDTLLQGFLSASMQLHVAAE